MQALELAQKAIDKRKNLQELHDILQDATTYVLYTLSKNGVIYTTRWEKEGKQLSNAEIFLLIQQQYFHDVALVGRDNLVVHQSSEMLQKGTMVAKQTFLDAYVDTIRQKVAYNPLARLSLWEDFSQELTGLTKYADLFRQWAWSVKRKLNDQVAIDSIFPILCAREQGIGKSYSCQLLSEPFGRLVGSATAGELIDAKNISTLQDNFIVICDEMSGMNKVEIDNLKNIVTAQSKTVRRLYERDVETVTLRACFIGSSNKKVADIIRDGTGNRRFLEIPCISTMNPRRIEKLNFLEMWQSIDNNLARGYWTDTLHEIKNASNEIAQIRHQTPVEAFVEEHNIQKGDVENKFMTFFSVFNRFCIERNHKLIPWPELKTKLIGMGIKITNTTVYLDRDINPM